MKRQIVLDEKYLKLLKDIIKRNVNFLQYKIYVFGSRTNGKAREYSDIDLAVDFNGSKLPPDIELNLKIGFEDSLLPYKVDIVDLNNISDSFKKRISNQLIEIDF
ncbi:MAG: nucleotidyltransferase domain-containing protein [Endomicrobium sp.]|jgi:predicted nucleotidyltransferase|nr:nucleotidyltransferase domain-containing protein [Endomicrobium sp.]